MYVCVSAETLSVVRDTEEDGSVYEVCGQASCEIASAWKFNFEKSFIGRLVYYNKKYFFVLSPKGVYTINRYYLF